MQATPAASSTSSSSSSAAAPKFTRTTTTSSISATASTTKTISGGNNAAKHKTQHQLANDSATNSEIEEISKKISEHADAIYRTWKSRGLAPVELLEFGGIEGVVGGGEAGSNLFASEMASTTEGLQKLVNTFVIKDKEKRGVKTTPTTTSNINKNVGSATKSAAGGTTGTTTATTTAKNKNAILKTTTPAKDEINTHTTTHNIAAGDKIIQKTTTATKPAITPKTTTIITKNLSKQSTEANNKNHDATTPLKSKTKTITTTSTTATGSGTVTTKTKEIFKNNALHDNNNDNTLQTHEQQQHKTTPTTINKFSQLKNKNENALGGGINKSKTTTTSSSNPTKVSKSSAILHPPPLDINLNLDLGLDLDLNLNLDVNNLSQLQTQNLRKIKELLQENEKTNVITPKATTTTTTKVKKVTPINKVEAEKKATTTTHLANVTAVTPKTNEKTTTAPATTTTTKHKIIKNNNNVAASDKISCSNDLDVADSYAATDKNSTTTTCNSNGNDISSSSNSNNLNNKRSNATTEKVIKNLNETTEQSNNQINNNKIVKTTTKLIKATANSSNNSSSGSGSVSVNHSVNNSSDSVKPTTIKDKTDKKELKSSNTTATTSAITTTTTLATSAIAATNNNNMDVAPRTTTMPTAAAPTKFKSARGSLLTNGQDKNLGRPILTRGSVAERVLMFEKCPDVRNAFLNIKRPTAAEAPPKSLLKVKLHATPPTPPEHNSLQREIRSTKSVYIPRFYFPHGKPQPTIALERTLRGILSAFDSFPNNQVTKDELPRILKLCGLPFYWRLPVLLFCQQGNSGLVERQRFVEFWKQMNVYCHDAASRFVYILSRGQRSRSYILPEDMAPLVQDVVDTHPGLAFLKEATEFHSRYVHTVIARIFYAVNRSWSGRISISELKKSDLLEIITLLEEEDDINQIMAFFSYEHFYVIYCKFWELDKDHDLLINQEDLARHSDHALSTRIVDRIFSGCVTRTDNKKSTDDESKMSYTDFVWFLLSEEDKRTPTAIEYWFRCMDIDGDGVLSMYELEYFYEEQQQRMESIGIECLPFEDCLCQMLDMIKPQQRDCVTLGDLKKCKMTHVFFDTFFNLEKYLDHEQRDPFASQRDEYISDWDRFAAQEYELLISEENE